MAVTVPLFLCPSDEAKIVSPGFGPTNYAACAGSGLPGGSQLDTDGVFYVNSHTRISQDRRRHEPHGSIFGKRAGNHQMAVRFRKTIASITRYAGPPFSTHHAAVYDAYRYRLRQRGPVEHQ